MMGTHAPQAAALGALGIRHAAAVEALGMFIRERREARALTATDIAHTSGIPLHVVRHNLRNPDRWDLSELGRLGEAMGDACVPFTLAALEVYATAAGCWE